MSDVLEEFLDVLSDDELRNLVLNALPLTPSYRLPRAWQGESASRGRLLKIIDDLVMAGFDEACAELDGLRAGFHEDYLRSYWVPRFLFGKDVEPPHYV